MAPCSSSPCTPALGCHRGARRRRHPRGRERNEYRGGLVVAPGRTLVVVRRALVRLAWTCAVQTPVPSWLETLRARKRRGPEAEPPEQDSTARAGNRAFRPAQFRIPARKRAAFPSYATEADLGLRPRRAAARPGMRPAQLSQRSACFAPRRASVYVTRITAPFPSSTSFPQLSHTSTVFRATVLLLHDAICGKPSETRGVLRSLACTPNSPRPQQAEHRLFFRR